MPSSNVDVVRGFFDAFHGGAVEGWSGYLSPDAVMIEAREFPGATDRHGRQEVIAAIADWGLAWSEMGFEVDEFEVRDPLVLAVGRMHMRGEGTGMVFENPAAFQFTVEDGSIVRVEAFMDIEEGRRRTQEGVRGT